MEAHRERLNIAVVGAGIAGITAAWLLSKRHDVTLFERNTRLGGHTNTIVVDDPHVGKLPVDTGFIVCNPRTYPCFYALLDEWGVERRDSDMSFGYACADSGLQYVGPALRDFLQRPRNLLNPRFLKLIAEQRRFNRLALSALDNGSLTDRTLGDYLRHIGADPYFIRHYLLPLAASVWSSPDGGMLDFPAASFIRFFANHGLLTLHDRPTWQTIVGGSHSYLAAFEHRFGGEIFTIATITAVHRAPTGIVIDQRDAPSRRFDHVVMACHADETLALLADASTEEHRLLSAWSYHRNPTVLHTDASIMPPNRRLWASWNYHRRDDDHATDPVSITYYMNRLQGFTGTADYFVSLNQNDAIDPHRILYQIEYTHPAYTLASIDAQLKLRALSGTRNTHYCGSYMRYGFHEDAVVSACNVADDILAASPALEVAS